MNRDRYRDSKGGCFRTVQTLVHRQHSLIDARAKSSRISAGANQSRHEPLISVYTVCSKEYPDTFDALLVLQEEWLAKTRDRRAKNERAPKFALTPFDRQDP